MYFREGMGMEKSASSISKICPKDRMSLSLGVGNSDLLLLVSLKATPLEHSGGECRWGLLTQSFAFV